MNKYLLLRDNKQTGPYTVPVRCNAPPRIKVQGVNGAPLPTVTLRAALSPALSKWERDLKFVIRD